MGKNWVVTSAVYVALATIPAALLVRLKGYYDNKKDKAALRD